jgi:hypothetical protein
MASGSRFALVGTVSSAFAPGRGFAPGPPIEPSAPCRFVVPVLEAFAEIARCGPGYPERPHWPSRQFLRSQTAPQQRRRCRAGVRGLPRLRAIIGQGAIEHDDSRRRLRELVVESVERNLCRGDEETKNESRERRHQAGPQLYDSRRIFAQVMVGKESAKTMFECWDGKPAPQCPTEDVASAPKSCLVVGRTLGARHTEVSIVTSNRSLADSVNSGRRMPEDCGLPATVMKGRYGR